MWPVVDRAKMYLRPFSVDYCLEYTYFMNIDQERLQEAPNNDPAFPPPYNIKIQDSWA
jgi:hypothetical protein